MGERNDLIERLIRASKKAYDEPDGQGIEMADLLARAFTTIATLSEALAEAEKKGAEARETLAFEFDRYINGVLMAEGIIIERQHTLAAAMREAACIAARGAQGEVPVLVLKEAATTIASLSEALAEAEKKGNASAARFTRLHTIASKIRWNDLGLPALNNASTQEGLMELSQFLLQDALEECLDRQGLPPRDLSQGGQHG